MSEDLEEKKRLEERSHRAAERHHDELDAYAKQTNDAAIQSGQLALRMSMLVNGGAAVAVLTFLGALSSTVGMQEVSRLASTIEWFAWGVGAAVLGMAFGYLTNYCHVSHTHSFIRTWDHPYSTPSDTTKYWSVAGTVVHVGAVAAAISSLGLFVIGMIEVREGIRQIPPPPAPTMRGRQA